MYDERVSCSHVFYYILRCDFKTYIDRNCSILLWNTTLASFIFLKINIHVFINPPPPSDSHQLNNTQFEPVYRVNCFKLLIDLFISSYPYRISIKSLLNCSWVIRLQFKFWNCESIGKLFYWNNANIPYSCFWKSAFFYEKKNQY